MSPRDRETPSRGTGAYAVAERIVARVAGHAHTGAVVAIAYFFAVAALALRHHYMSDGDAESDFFGAYVLQARALLDGRLVIDPYRGPVYPMVLALVGSLPKPGGTGLFEAGIVLSAASAAFAVYLSHRVVRRITTPGIALAATLFLVANPIYFRYSYTCGTDMFFVAVAMVVVALTLGTPRNALLRAAALGAVLALVYLTRYNGAVFVVVAVVCVALLDVWRLGARARVLVALVVVGVFAALITPWGLYCHGQKGSFFYSLNHMNVAYSLLPAGSNADVAAGGRFEGLHGMGDVLRAFPRELAASMPQRAWHQLVAGMGGVMRWPVGVAVILGLATLGLRRPSRREAAYYAFAAAFFVVLLFVFYSDRFGLFLIPAYAVLAVRGVIVWPSVVAAWSARAWLRRVGGVVLAGLLAFSAASCVRYNRWAMPGGDLRVRTMAEWFVDNVPAHLRGTRVVARKPEFAYFAGLEPVSLPVLGSHRELLHYLDAQDADYLFFSYVAAATRPQLSYLLDAKRPVPGLRLVVTGKAASLYHVDPAPVVSDPPSVGN